MMHPMIPVKLDIKVTKPKGDVLDIDFSDIPREGMANKWLETLLSPSESKIMKKGKGKTSIDEATTLTVDSARRESQLGLKDKKKKKKRKSQEGSVSPMSDSSDLSQKRGRKKKRASSSTSGTSLDSDLSDETLSRRKRSEEARRRREERERRWREQDEADEAAWEAEGLSEEEKAIRRAEREKQRNLERQRDEEEEKRRRIQERERRWAEEDEADEAAWEAEGLSEEEKALRRARKAEARRLECLDEEDLTSRRRKKKGRKGQLDTSESSSGEDKTSSTRREKDEGKKKRRRGQSKFFPWLIPRFPGWDLGSSLGDHEMDHLPTEIEVAEMLYKMKLAAAEKGDVCADGSDTDTEGREGKEGVHQQGDVKLKDKAKMRERMQYPWISGQHYIAHHGIHELFQFMIAQLVSEQPDKPLDFLIDMAREIDRQNKIRKSVMSPPTQEAPRIAESISVSSSSTRKFGIRSVSSQREMSSSSRTVTIQMEKFQETDETDTAPVTPLGKRSDKMISNPQKPVKDRRSSSPT